jgi:hypothetical protein
MLAKSTNLPQRAVLTKSSYSSSATTASKLARATTTQEARGIAKSADKKVEEFNEVVTGLESMNLYADLMAQNQAHFGRVMVSTKLGALLLVTTCQTVAERQDKLINANHGQGGALWQWQPSTCAIV